MRMLSAYDIARARRRRNAIHVGRYHVRKASA